jgi:small subunit ribosomal protein S1
MHQGTVISASDKGVVVSLPYGVEGFCPSRYMKKEDGSNAQVDDSLEFKVLEFNKESKKIILALPKVEEEKEAAPAKTAEEKAADKAAKQAKRTVKQINDNIEHSTLGDLEVLAGLKENLEKQEKAQQGE